MDSPLTTHRVTKHESRRERKKAQCKQALYETALRLFTERGYENVSVEDVTEEVDVSRSTFFAYFPTKDQVLIQYRNSLYDEMHRFAETLTEPSGVTMCRKYVRKLVRLIQREGDRYRMAECALGARTALLSQEDGGRIQRTCGHYQRFVEAAIQTGELAPKTDSELLAEIIRDVVLGNFHEWVMKRRASSLEKRMMRKLDLIFHPLRS